MSRTRRQGGAGELGALGGCQWQTQPLACPDRSCALFTPRISLDDLKTAVRAGAPCTSSVASAVYGRVRGSGVYQGWCRLGSTGWVLLPPPHPATAHWYCQGPTTSIAPVHASSMALQAPAGPSAHHASSRGQIALLEPIRTRFSQIYPKVSRILECHRNIVMRPGILPISKTGSNATTLNSKDFHLGQPSLPRNNWSRF